MAQRLTRDTQHAVVAGVAAGLGEYFGVDPVLARLVFVLLAFMSGVGVIGYLVCWVIMPRKDEPAGAPAGAPTPAGRVAAEVQEAGERIAEGLRSAGRGEKRSRVVAGAILIGLGMVFLTDQMWWWRWPSWLRPGNVWPVIVMIIGASIIWQAARGTRK